MTTTSLSDRHLPSVPIRARNVALGFSVGLLAGVALLIVASLGIGLATGSAVMPRVSVAGIAIGGLSRDAAAQRLAEQLPSLTTGALTVRAAGETVEVPYARFARTYDTDAMLDVALAVGRDSNPIAAGVARLRAELNETSLPAIVRVDDAAAVDAVVAELAEHFGTLASSASVRFDDGEFTVIPATNGSRLDVAALRERLGAIAATADSVDRTLELRTLPIVPGVTTAQAQAALDEAAAMTAAPISLVSEAPARDGKTAEAVRLDLSPGQLRALIAFGGIGDGYHAELDRAAATKVIGGLATKLKVEPRDAGFTFNAKGISGVTPAVVGRALDVDASVQALASAFSARVGGDRGPSDVQLAMSVTQPPLTTEAAKAALPKMKRFSTWTTYYVPGESNYWGANISIPARDLNGYVLGPGEWFSFWNGIGPVTTARGYGYGGVIINGRSYPTGALAGGICSTSTTLFNAAMRAGLEIGDRTNHSYYITRYPVGLDATVLKTDTSVTDMTFRNDTENPIVIRSYTGTGFVRFDLWGVPDGRTVNLSKASTSNHVAARDTVVVNAKMKPGTSKRIESPHDGFHAVVSRTVRGKDGAVLHHDVWESFYRVVNGVTEVGPTPSAPPPPPSPEPSIPPPVA
jgi:vancomycin resistance protein YoaR